MKRLIRNQGTNYFINDMGVTVPASSELIVDPVMYEIMARSNDIVLALSNGDLVYNDGTNNLGLSDAVDHIKGYLPKQVAISEQPPFAKPDYRTKRDRTPSIVTVAPSSQEIIDFQLTEERYASGGSIIFDGAEIGDWVEAQIHDTNSVIPAPYRSAEVGLCENWPIVASYILGQWVPKGSGMLEINTYPLNAKITAGLFLRVIYHAANTGSNRQIGVNYHLTKKLV
jgi:hypothetical protein